MTKEEFETKTNSGKLILVDFFATWCGPCQMMKPIMEEMEEKFKDDKDVEILAVDIDENPQIPAIYSVMSVPSFVFIKDRKAIDTVIGAVPADNLLEKIEKYKKEK